jgi:DNA invertase Pin-like site-specific DNA recombinase
VPRFILYARKSTESEDRQVLSIESQIRELTEYAHAQKFEIASVRSESRSAKAPGRPVFGQILADIAHGRADALLCWKLDRLARNPVDGGALIWAIDQGKLREIVTREKTFTNRGDEKFWMQLEFGIAKKYIDDLSDNVKRGLRAKLAQGWRPGLAPLGYRNDLAGKTLVLDPDRSPLVRKIWDLALASYSPVEILRIANKEWGFRTPRRKKSGELPLARSTLYKLLTNPFYYGLVVYSGESYPGAHQPLVTKDEFDRVQELLGRPNREPYRRWPFAFRAMIRCGECGMSVTPEEKVNRYGSKYTYYHCTKRRRDYRCGQRTIRAERLEAQIVEILGRIEVNDAYRDWALANLHVVHDEDTKSSQSAVQSLQNADVDIQKQVHALLDLRLKRFLTDAEYGEKKRALVAEQLRLQEQLNDFDGRPKQWLELSEKAFFFANQARNRFTGGSMEEKREIAIAVGSNFVLRDRILRIELQKPFRLIEEARQNPRHRGLVDGIRTFFEEHPKLIQWPSFCREGASSTASSPHETSVASGLSEA